MTTNMPNIDAIRTGWASQGASDECDAKGHVAWEHVTREAARFYERYDRELCPRCMGFHRDRFGVQTISAHAFHNVELCDDIMGDDEAEAYVWCHDCNETALYVESLVYA